MKDGAAASGRTELCCTSLMPQSTVLLCCSKRANNPCPWLCPPRRQQHVRRSVCGRSGRCSARSTRRSRWAGVCRQDQQPAVWGRGLHAPTFGVMPLRMCSAEPPLYMCSAEPAADLPAAAPQAKLDAEIAARAEQERLIIEQQRAAARAAEDQRRRCVQAAAVCLGALSAAGLPGAGDTARIAQPDCWCTHVSIVCCCREEEERRRKLEEERRQREEQERLER